MREPWNWDLPDLENLIGQMETHRLDFKESKLFSQPRERIAENLSKEVSAFANSEGGVIVIGMKEKRIGKARVADDIDEGIDINKWSPEQLQQIIESNISPYLTGIRYKPIFLNSDKLKFAYVIYVPQGFTAYQASDFRYYGRFEYEVKALPDHEIRLRMNRGKTPNALIKFANKGKKDITIVSAENIPRSRHEFFKTEFVKLESGMEFQICEYSFDIGIENIGEVNITEFKVKLDNFTDGKLTFENISQSYKDGWPNYYSFLPRIFDNKERQPDPMRINIFPKDRLTLRTYNFHLLRDENLEEFSFLINWTIYLANSLPIRGQINVISEFESNN